MHVRMHKSNEWSTILLITNECQYITRVVYAIPLDDTRYYNYRGIITRIVIHFLCLLCSRKLMRRTTRVGDGACMAMAKQFTMHKVVVACVIGD